MTNLIHGVAVRGENVAEHSRHGVFLRSPRQNFKSRRVGFGDQVAFENAGKPLYGRTVETHSLIERFWEFVSRYRERFNGAKNIHKPDFDKPHALLMADNVITYKIVVKSIAWEAGAYASFMPKPIFGENGSGMHTHQSLFSGGKNAFFSAEDKYNLSEDAKHYIAGVMKHAREICAVTNQWVNSYKRLVPGYEAPVYIVWGRRNRSALVRVPMYKPGKENATRIEIRFPDPACNPYLAFSVMLAAGLDGIKNKYPMPEPVEIDVFHLSEKERRDMGIEVLPGSLIEAIQELENSELLKNALGEHIFEKLIENKKIEWDKYRQQVTGFEIEKYLPIL